MRKTELKNCPQWLLDADTENEDVIFDDYGRIQWNSGNFWGGNFRGGDFRGGEFWGGDFRGGNFWGGDFWGGNFWGGNFRGEKLNHKPISIYGLTWPIMITGNQMKIGCQTHTHGKWRNFADFEIKEMESRATEFWRTNKDFLLSICDHEKLLTEFYDKENAK